MTSDDMKKYYFTVIGIVVIVAVVGLTQVFAGSKAKVYSSGDSEYNLVGQAGEILELEASESRLRKNCTDSDGGKNIFVKGVASGPEWATGKFVRKVDYCITKGVKKGRLAEFYCENGQVTSQTYGPEDGCDKCVNGACVVNCASHSISITEVLNKNGKIAVSYDSAGVEDKVNAQLLMTNPGGSPKLFDCPITSGVCSASPISPISCTVNTECLYPTEQQNTRYFIRLTDQACPKVYDEEEIKPLTY